MQTGQSYLEERKILPATIQAHRLEVDVAPTAERIVQRLGEDILLAGQPLSQYSAELLWFPYLNADGAITSWTARIFPTPVNGPKFLTPKGGNGAPYITPAVWAIADKAHLPLIITEGPCKALSCIQAGFPAVGLNGVYGATARDADDKIVLHPLLSSINWVKRTVLLGFDADLTSKFDVRKALFRTYLVLAAQQADVFTITSWDVDQAKGIDDFLATGDKPEEQLELLIKDRAPFLSILEKSGADLRLVEEELTAVPLPRLHRAQIIRQLAKEVGVPAKDLLTAISPPETEGGNHRQLNLVDETVPWDAPVGGMDLFKDIYKLLGQVMWMTDSARMTITFWVIAAFAFTVFRKFPYLRIKSADRNCGKSTLIDLLAELVFKPLIAADVTPAGLYRAAEEFQPTILLDEFDNAEQIKELTQLLNAGYDANRVAVRYNTDKGALERFRTFCPKIIASIRRLAETTESRCLPIDMQRVPSDAEKKLKELCDIEPANLLAVKRKILAWIEDNLAQIKTARPERPDWLKTRDWDVWRAPFVIAEVIGESAPNLVRRAATETFKDRVVEQSLAIEILAHIREAAKQTYVVIEPEGGKIFLPSEKLVEYCNGDPEASWADWGKGDQQGLTVHRLARELRQHFKVHSKRIGYQNKDVRGYWLKDLQRHFDSFLPPEDEPPPPGSQAREDHKQGAPPPAARRTAESANFEEENARWQPEKEAQSGGMTGSSSESTTSLRHFPENEVALRHFENSEVAASSSTSAESYEGSATFGVEISPRMQNVFLAIDVETSAELRSGGEVSRDVLDPHKCELRILSAALPDGKVVVHDFRTGTLPDYLRAAIATMPLLTHGAAFDLAVLQGNGYKTSNDVFCTQTASRLLTAGLRDSNTLGAALKRYLGLDLPKQLGASDWGGMILTDQQLEYCRNDVRHLHGLQEVLQAHLANPGNEHGDGIEGVDLVRVSQLEMALIPLVTDVRVRGIKIDRPRLEQCLSTYEANKKQLAAELRAELQLPKLNFASAKQLLAALRALGLEIEDTNKDTLSAVVNPIAGRIVRHRQLASLCTTMRAWLESLDADDRLYPPLNPLGAETGRFSCKAPNLLATPRNSEIRGCIIADDGFVLIDPDLANIEMRIAAWFAQEQQMLNIFRNGGDIHGETAARILGDRQARQSAKPVNFGSLYGGGAERLRITARTYGIEFSPEQAKQYHQQFFATYGNLRRWHESAKDASSELTYGATVYGRRRWADPEDSADAWDWNRFQLATNFEVQGVGCDALKIALVQLHQQFANSPTRILLPIHDAILVQTPEGAAEGVAETIGHAMREAFAAIFGPNFPVAVETNISKRWGDGK